MSRHGRAGFSMLELMVVVLVISVVAAAAVPSLERMFANQRLRGATRSLADLLALARSEAIRTGTNHLVFFGQDPLGNPLPTDADGTRYAAVAVRDDDGDGLLDAGEPFTGARPVAGVFWGVAGATAAAPGDPDPLGAFSGPGFPGFTFQDPPLAAAARWLVFRPDGIPLPLDAAPYAEGEAGEGGGAVYVNDQTRDQAVVLSPIGGVGVAAWDASQAQWR